LLFEATPGDPLTDSELQGAIEAVRLYRDDGSGAFDPGVDTLAAAFIGLDPTAGVVDFYPPETLVPQASASSAAYFLTLELRPNASSGAVTGVVVSNPADAVGALNADFDTFLSREPGASVSSSFQIVPSPFGEGFDDGFESGNLAAWSGVQPPLPP
jgi:hypothetical protein